MVFNLNNEYEREKYREYCRALEETRGIVEVTKRRRKMSRSQRGYLHVILGYYASEFGYTLEEVKYDVFKKQVNYEIFKSERKNKRGETVTYLRSTESLDTKEMTLAIERFRNYSSAVAGLYLPAPNEDQMLLFAEQQIARYQEFL